MALQMDWHLQIMPALSTFNTLPLKNIVMKLVIEQNGS